MENNEKQIDLTPAEDFIRGFFRGLGIERTVHPTNTDYINGLEFKYNDRQGVERLLPIENIKELVRLAYKAGVQDGRKE